MVSAGRRIVLAAGAGVVSRVRYRRRRARNSRLARMHARRGKGVHPEYTDDERGNEQQRSRTRSRVRDRVAPRRHRLQRTYAGAVTNACGVRSTRRSS